MLSFFCRIPSYGEIVGDDEVQWASNFISKIFTGEVKQCFNFILCELPVISIFLIRCLMCWSRTSQTLKNRKNLNGNLISDLRNQMPCL